MLVTFSNQSFCYWLQGYFEIDREPYLNKPKLELIHTMLRNINEPLGEFTQWLSTVVDFLAAQEYQQAIVDCFFQEISGRLNSIFYHVIDNSYDTKMSLEALRDIHHGSNA